MSTARIKELYTRSVTDKSTYHLRTQPTVRQYKDGTPAQVSPSRSRFQLVSNNFQLSCQNRFLPNLPSLQCHLHEYALTHW